MSALSPLVIRWLGRQPYETTWALQKELLGPIADDEAPETLLLVEHEPVITLGRKAGAADNVLSPDFPVIATERGGDATYHGPGQLVAYPLLALREGERDLHRYLRNLEALVIATLADYGLPGERREGLTGVWVHDKKVASVGVAVRRWVTYHGLALNVSADLGHFARLNPCGLQSDVMAGMATWLDAPPSLREVAERLVAHLPETLARRAQPMAVELT